MKTLITIMAHGDTVAQQCFERHLNYWRAHGYPIVVMCPQDSYVITGLQTILIGKRGHHGKHANQRFLDLLYTLLHATKDFDRHVIFEYDSLCLSAELPIGEKEGVYGMAFRDDRLFRSFPGSINEFEGRTFIHPPIAMTKTTMANVVKSMESIPITSSHGLWDRYLGYACERGMIPVHCLRSTGHGFSRNTIAPSDLPEACEAAAHGATVFHGVKSPGVLKSIVAASQGRQQASFSV